MSSCRVASKEMSSCSMAYIRRLLGFILLNSVFSSSCFSLHEQNIRKTYIVQTLHTSMPSVFTSPASWYTSTLASVMHGNQFTQASTSSSINHDNGSTNLIYTYRFASQGFAARLTEAEAASLAQVPGFLSVMPDKLYSLQTTYTPEFIGLAPHYGLWPEATLGKDVIVGILDTGVWPESESFNDADMTPVPARWKGRCVAGFDFNPSLCNKKLIGAKYFLSDGVMPDQEPLDSTRIVEHRSPRDVQGHGTHTASTAAGAPVANASFFGYANGTAKGIAPMARIAVYKVCWASLGGCLGADLLAAMDEAISDGVDVLSVSLGGQAVPFYEDPLALGAFGALVDHGILVTCAAGNAGPSRGSVLNIAPWLLTVAASTVDRSFPATVKLGNGDTYVGQSLYTGERPNAEQLPLVASGLCDEGSLDTMNVEGKIVICQQGSELRQHSATAVVAAAGGAAEIMVQRELLGRSILASSFLLPSVSVRADHGAAIQKYAAIQSSRPKALVGNNGQTTAAIFINGTKFGNQRAPAIASFSSRGPNLIVPSILKPDLAMPGVDILAAWSGAVAPTQDPADDRETAFNIISGTSMACPHATGVVALLRAAHPQWSAAAVKSALMTTARSTDSSGKPILDDYEGTPATPFEYGAGHVNPNAALDPGLVYDISVQDYINFLCELGYPEQYMMLFTRGRGDCSKQLSKDESQGLGYDLNYPALSVVFNARQVGNETTTLRRVVTNVGAAGSEYTVEVEVPKGVIVKVRPEKLSFAEEGEKHSFEVVITSTRESMYEGEEILTLRSSFGFLTWVGSKKAHKVRSPLVITWFT